MAVDPNLAFDLAPRFDDLEELSRGDRCVVCKARDTELSRLVTLKAFEKSPAYRAGVLPLHVIQETQVLARLNSESTPNIPHPYSLSEVEGRYVFVREYIAGETLSALLSRKALDLRQVVTILAAVSRVVARVHGLQFVHGNLGPDNVLVATDGTARLIGFGRVRRLATAENPDEPVRADLARLHQLLAFSCSFVPQPIPEDLVLHCKALPPRRMEPFLELLDRYRELLSAGGSGP